MRRPGSWLRVRAVVFGRRTTTSVCSWTAVMDTSPGPGRGTVTETRVPDSGRVWEPRGPGRRPAQVGRRPGGRSARDLLDRVERVVERVVGRGALGLDVGQLRGERLLHLRVVETDRRDLHLAGDVTEDLSDGRVAEVGALRSAHTRSRCGLGVRRE